jgi:hypothetical protein
MMQMNTRPTAHAADRSSWSDGAPVRREEWLSRRLGWVKCATAPGGGIYQVVATPKQTGNLHFAFETTEPPGGGPPLHIRTRHEELFFVSKARSPSDSMAR